MGKYKVEITRIDEYEIEVDEDIWNEEELKEWTSCFWDVEGVKGLAESLGANVARNTSSGGHYEGFGYVQMLNKDGSKRIVWDGMRIVDESEIAKGIKVRIISEDEDLEVTSELIKQ